MGTKEIGEQIEKKRKETKGEGNFYFKIPNPQNS